MSASPMARAVETKAIAIKKVVINDPSELPSHYSSTPGGTLYSTTPGGTKVVYEKSLLLHLRNSPLSKTPPNFDIPEHLMPGSDNRRNSLNKNGPPKPQKHYQHHHHHHHNHHHPPAHGGAANVQKKHEDEQFDLEL